MEIRNLKRITSTSIIKDEYKLEDMKFVKTFYLGNNVEVLIKKVIINDKFWGIEMQFITEIDDNMVHMGITGEYNFKAKRDKAFDTLNEERLKNIAKTLPTFKDIVNK